jgi:integrase
VNLPVPAAGGRMPWDYPTDVHPDEQPLSPGAQELVAGGIPATTRATYRNAWGWHTAFCEERDLEAVPCAESTMLELIEAWRSLPVHNRCTGGRQANGEPCHGHRPAPSSLWVWYSAVRLAHSLPTPPWPWYGGKRLALAMKHYSEEMRLRLGWKPNKAPRAWPEHVMAMVDALDLDDEKDVRDRAILLTNWRTGGRASDLGTYRITDVAFTPLGVDLTLVASKTNKAVGKKEERRVLRPHPDGPRYCAVTALQAWVHLLRERHGITQGALFRPYTKPGPKTGRRTLLRGHRDELGYRMDGVSLSSVIQECAERAGVPDAEYFTCHSLRRGRATHLRMLGVDSLAIGRALGWAGLPPKEYMEEAEAFDDTAPANIGHLG